MRDETDDRQIVVGAGHVVLLPFYCSSAASSRRMMCPRERFTGPACWNSLSILVTDSRYLALDKLRIYCSLYLFDLWLLILQNRDPNKHQNAACNLPGIQALA